MKRRIRGRKSAPETLTSIWNDGQPPPEWAFSPGDHNDELTGLYFFADGDISWHDHPEKSAWTEAFKASVDN